MRVVHVTPELGVEANGQAQAVTRLCESQRHAGVDARLAALTTAQGHSHPLVNTFPSGRGPKRLGISPTMREWLHAQATSNTCDLFHSHGLWRMPNIYPAVVCRRYSQCRLVVSPHGMLSAWALHHHPLRKAVFWHALQNAAIRRAECLHAASVSEYEDIRRCDLTQPIAIIPFGVDIPPAAGPGDRERRRLLFLGRVHPKKGIDILLRAWHVVESRFQDWDLQIVGPDERGYLSKMKHLASRLRLCRVTFTGPLYGPDKLSAYRRADLFVLPTHSENFGLSVAEALAAGTPVVVTAGAPWSSIETHRAGWSIDVGLDPLVACLEKAMARSPSELARMGESGRRWMIRDYCWDRVGARHAATYEWLRSGGSVPSCVALS